MAGLLSWWPCSPAKPSSLPPFFMCGGEVPPSGRGWGSAARSSSSVWVLTTTTACRRTRLSCLVWWGGQAGRVACVGVTGGGGEAARGGCSQERFKHPGEKEGWSWWVVSDSGVS